MNYSANSKDDKPNSIVVLLLADDKPKYVEESRCHIAFIDMHLDPYAAVGFFLNMTTTFVWMNLIMDQLNYYIYLCTNAQNKSSSNKSK